MLERAVLAIDAACVQVAGARSMQVTVGVAVGVAIAGLRVGASAVFAGDCVGIGTAVHAATKGARSHRAIRAVISSRVRRVNVHECSDVRGVYDVWMRAGCPPRG
jgi:hypothetical protein